MRHGEITPLVTHFNGKRFNSPNDVVVTAAGGIYFTDPPYGTYDGMSPTEAYWLRQHTCYAAASNTPETKSAYGRGKVGDGTVTSVHKPAL